MQFRQLKQALKLGGLAVALSALAGCDFLAGIGQHVADKYADHVPPTKYYIDAYAIMSVGEHSAAVLGFDECPQMQTNEDPAFWLTLPGTKRTYAANVLQCTHIPVADGDINVRLFWVRKPDQDFTPEAPQTVETWHVSYRDHKMVLQRPNGEFVTPLKEQS